MCYEEVTACLEARRLLLFIIVLLENQGDKRNKEQSELNQFFPCNHVHTPSHTGLGAKKSITPEKIRGKPPTGVLVAPETE